MRVLVAAGKPVEAQDLGLALLPRLAPAEQADLLVGLAQAALTTGDVASAERDVAAARALLAEAAGPGAAGPDAPAGPDAARRTRRRRRIARGRRTGRGRRATRPAPQPQRTEPPDRGGGARRRTGTAAEAVTAARLDAVAAAVALDQVRLDDAIRLGRVALAAAERADQPEVQCEALEVIGRAERGWAASAPPVGGSSGPPRWPSATG